jgi:ParB family chromosome partitioning protein
VATKPKMGKMESRLIKKTAGIDREKQPVTPHSAAAVPAPAPAPHETAPLPHENVPTPNGAAPLPLEAAPLPLEAVPSPNEPAPPTNDAGTEAPLTAPTPRAPVSMPGQLGAFRNEAQRLLDKIAEKDAEIDALKKSSDRVQRISLALVDDSPYQPRLEYDPAEIDALGKTLVASRQADPIKVRKVGERYELISGHRRKRAALSIGWTEIDAIVEVRTNDEAELESMLLVVANVNLCDYEFAKMYRRALVKKFCKTQEDVAKMFGVTQTAVSHRLNMLTLSAPILEMLEAKPSLLAYTTAGVIKDLIQAHPKHTSLIVKGVRRLVEEGAKQNSLKGWILQAIAQQDRKAKPPQDTRTITRDGHEVFTTKKKTNSVTVSIKAQDMDSSQFEKDLHKWLDEYANRSRSE